MKRVIVIGNGVTGLTAAYILKCQGGRNVDIKVIGSGENGGDFLNCGVKYIRLDHRIVSLFEDLNLQHSNYSIKGGVWLRGSVHPYPICFKNVDKDEVNRIKEDYYRKSRLLEPGRYALKAFNDPESNRPPRAIRTDFEILVKKLSQVSRIIKQKAMCVTDFFVFTKEGGRYQYDYLVFAIPLWEIRKCYTGADVSTGTAVKMNSVILGAYGGTYEEWDFVLTPYTPANSVYKIVCRSESEYSIESSGNFCKSRVFSDINFLFRDGWFIKDIHLNLKGYMLPFEKERIRWPENVAPLGRYAVWDNRVTLDSILKETLKLSKRWF